MNRLKKDKNYLKLAKIKLSVWGLLFVLGLFLLPKTAHLSTTEERDIFRLINELRTEKEIPELRVNQLLTQAAIAKAEDIFKEDSFAHNINGKRFSSWIKDTGYSYKYVGENLAIDFLRAESAVEAWVESPSHYKNIVNEKFTETGLAVVEKEFKGSTSTLVVHIFGTPLKKDVELGEIADNYTGKNNISLEGNRITDINYDYPLELGSESKLEISDSEYPLKNNQKNKISDILFTFVGFLYVLGLKLLSLKNI